MEEIYKLCPKHNIRLIAVPDNALRMVMPGAQIPPPLPGEIFRHIHYCAGHPGRCDTRFQCEDRDCKTDLEDSEIQGIYSEFSVIES
jgi:hypothetical protein